MTYLVKGLTTSTHPTRVGETPGLNNWVNGKIQEVDDDLISWYSARTDAYTVLSQNGSSPSTLVAKTGLTAIDNCLDGILHQTVFTLAGCTQALPNGDQFIGTKLYTFPGGRISVLGVVATLAETTKTAILTTLNGNKVGALALGTTVAAHTTLDGTMGDLMPTTAWASGTTIDVAGTAVSGALAAAAQFDGTTTAKELWLNASVPADGDVDGNATIAWTGTITVTWMNLGDYA